MSEKTKDVLLSIFASLLCIVIGLLVGLIILYCINAENALDGFSRIIKGGFYLKPKGIGSEIAQATPLIMTGLSVAFAFKTGLFNIGAAGQYTLGVFGALYFALILQMPWYVCLLAAMVCGAIWGAVPGIFKAYFNVNEVITSIMFNWIGLYLVNELMYSTVSGMYDQKTTRTYKLSSAAPQSLIPDCGMSAVFKTSSTTIAIFIAMAIAIIMYVVLNKTTFGYELKACGFNKDAAKYAGINETQHCAFHDNLRRTCRYRCGTLLSVRCIRVESAGVHSASGDRFQRYPGSTFGAEQSDRRGICSNLCRTYLRGRRVSSNQVLSAGDCGSDRGSHHLPVCVCYAL